MGASSVLNAFRRRVLGRREEEASKLIPLLNNPRSESSSEQQLVVYLANESQPLRLEYRPDYTVRDVCEEIAKILHILPVTLPFFTLVSKRSEDHCLNQQKKLSKTECGQEYSFKLAFKACVASRFKQPDINDVNVIQYLFHQSRQEFLDGLITFSKEEDKNQVKLVVLELIYQSMHLGVKPQKLVDNAKQYKTFNLLRRGIFRQYGIKEVKNYIKTHLPKFQDFSKEKLMLEYLHVVEQSEKFSVHTFTVYKQFRANGRNHNVEYELFISPQFGIKKKEVGQSSQAEVIVKDFSQVCGLEIGQTQSDQIIISRMESKAEVLSACSLQDAQSIVAIINGYYRLFVNRYRILNGLTIVPKFHGPISREMSISILQAKGEEDGLFLIRQSRKVFGFHVLSLMYDKQIQHYEIIKDDDGLLVLKDTTIKKHFKNLDAFVKYYKENQDGLTVCLKNNCPPSETANDALLNSYPLVPVAPRPQDLIQFGLESIKAKNIKLLTPIGKAGEFGNVILAEWTMKEGENPLKIAVRKLKKKIYDKRFFEVEKRLIQLRNINVIRHYGLTQLNNSVGMVTEYAAENLETYLKNAISSQPVRKGISKKSVILFAAQIAEGMMYLKNMECVHGRLKAHNILVATDEQIKIGDIGLIDLQHHGGEFIDVDRDNAGYCWHALEMLADHNSTPTHESDVWSLGVTIWEMFALKRPFHTSTSSKPLSPQEILKRYHRDQYLSTQRENLPEAVADVIQKCWKPREEERISFANIVTALRELVINATPEESVSYSLELVSEQKTEDWEKPMKEEKPIKPLELIEAGDSYSMMAPSEDNNHCTSCLTNPHQYVLYSTQGRKNSLQRTFSDPGSPKHLYEEPINEDLLTLPQRKVSLTRTSSYPQSKFFTTNEKTTPSEGNVVLTGESDKKKQMSFTQQAADYTPYHNERDGYSNTSRNTSYVVTTDDEDNQVMIDSYLESDQQQPTMEGEDEAMEFLKTEFLKASLKPQHLGVGNQQDHKESKEHQEDHDSAMNFLGKIMQEKRAGPLCSPSQLLQSGKSTTGQYVHHPSVESPLQSGNSTTGQYVPHPSVESPLQSGNSTTGQYVPHPSVVSSLQSSNSTTGQYVPQPSVVSPVQSGNSTTGQYVSQPHVVSPLQSGNSTSGQFVPPADSTTSLSEKNTFLAQRLDDFVSFHLKNDEDATGHTSFDHCKAGYVAVTPIHGHENPGYMEEHTLSSEMIDSSETSEGISGGWFCDVHTTICSKGYDTQVPINTTPVQENPGKHEPVCEDSANSSEKLDSPEMKQHQQTVDMQENHEDIRRGRLEEFQGQIDKDFRIEKANLRTMEELGRGNFGIVRRGILKKYVKSVLQEKDVAVKQLKKCPDEKSKDDFITEAINMQELRKIKNPHIVTPIGICLDIDSEDFMIVTELAPLGDLPKYLKAKKERIGVSKLLEFCLQIAKGMNSLEKENVLHRDLALRNILVAADDQVKISDFGFSRLSEYYKARGGKWPMKWYAPESLKHNTFTTKSDVWSYGVTVWEMFNYGELKPYPDVENSKILDYILKGNRLPQPENCPDSVYEIMNQCWDEDSKKRPSFYLLCSDLIPKEIQKLPEDLLEQVF